MSPRKRKSPDRDPSEGALPLLRTKPKKEAVCFTAGVPAATFAAGLIHAYLTANRPAPGVVAGVSLGALNAAAMQRCYLELEKARLQARRQGAAQPEAAAEPSRWPWFRQYLEALTTRPLSVLWDGLPDQSDFFADRAPVIDPAIALFPDPQRGEYEDRHRNARRDLYLFVKLGHWFASLPVPLSRFADAIVHKVRAEEKYPEPRIWRRLLYWIASGRLLIGILFHIAAAPKFFPEYKFRAPQEGRGTWLRQWWTWVLDKIVRWLPFNHQPGLTWALARGAFRTALGDAWKEEKEKRASRLAQPGKKNWWTLKWRALKATLAFSYNSVRAFFQALDSNFLVELPFRPLFGWPVWGASIALVAILVIGLALPVWNFALPRLVSVTRSLDFVRSEPALDRPLAATQSFLKEHQTQVTVWALNQAEHWRPIEQSRWLSDWVSQTRGSLRDQRATLFGFYSLITALVAVRVFRSRRSKLKYILKQVEMQRALVDDFHLRIALVRLFGKDGKSPTVGTRASPDEPEPIPLLIAAASLQMVPEKSKPGEAKQKDLSVQQLWARPEAFLTNSLRAALTLPGLLEPEEVKGKDVHHWVDPERVEAPEKLDLVDASVIRQNPLPALFGFLKIEEEKARSAGRAPLAHQLFSDEDHAAVHVLYGVPIQPEEKRFQESMDIVEVGRQSLELARRRDTQLEVQQTRTLSRLQRQVDLLASETASGVRYPIFADEIAPEKEIRFANPLSPTRDEILEEIAHGCRRTLERVFHSNLAEEGNGAEVDCPGFLTKQKEVQDRFQGQAFPALLGLPEVCTRCTQKLKGAELVKLTPYDLAPTFQNLQTRKWKPLSARFSKLVDRAKPRIIFVASGGVFRGAFHAGMLGAMVATQIRPNLIVGASVGTLMGGTLAAMMSARSYRDALEILGELVEVFLNVDAEIAFTKTLRTAARDLGLRGRLIPLSINKVRRAVKKGGQADPGFAAVGAPPGLIDAISNLFLIPHLATREIAAEFVAGHVTKAIRAFFSQLQKETLSRLDIRNALIGASLMEPVARKLLHLEGRADSSQPFSNVIFLGTTTNLASRRPFLLGLAEVESYDFVKAALASSAFPCVFEPRRESEVFPNMGRTDTLFSDGGMFDNLPFFPALFVLSETQKDFTKGSLGVHDWYHTLLNRHSKPDLMLAGSLDANPTPDDDEFDDLFQICKRASSLQNNVKIQGFVRAASKIDRQIEGLLQAYKKEVMGFPTAVEKFLGDRGFDVSRPQAQNFKKAVKAVSESPLQLTRVSQEEADEFRRAVTGFLRSLRDVSKMDEALVREFQAVTKDLAAALRKKKPEKYKIAGLQSKTGEMLSSIRSEFQVDKGLVEGLESAANDILEAVQRPDIISSALIRDLEAAAGALTDAPGPLTAEEQAQVVKFRKSVSTMIKVLGKAPELDPAVQAKFEESLNELAKAMRETGVTLEKVNELRSLAVSFVAKLKAIDREFLQGLVNPGVLPIYPADKDHLNGTFHFCASVGMERKRVRSSIANGCFQTLGTLADQEKAAEGQAELSRNVAARSLSGLQNEGRVPKVRWAPRQVRQKGHCPFFLHSAKPYESYTDHQLQTAPVEESFECPFLKAGTIESRKVFRACGKDRVHKKTFSGHREHRTQAAALAG